MGISVKGLLKAEFKKRGVTCAQLVDKFAKIGVSESESNIRNKLARGQIYSGLFDSMSGSNWGGKSALIGLILVFVLGLGYLTGRLELSERYKPVPDTPEACEEGDLANCDTLPMVLDPVTGEPHPGNANDNSYRDEYRSEKDLRAQQRMADWAFGMMILTGLGIGLLFMTWIETRNVTKETRRIGIAQTRAYLVADSVFIELKGSGASLRFTINFKNTGQSPAKKAFGEYSIRTYRLGTQEGDGSRQLIPNAEAEAGTFKVPEIGGGSIVRGLIFGQKITGDARNEFMKGSGMYIILSGKVWWEDVFGKGQTHSFGFTTDDAILYTSFFKVEKMQDSGGIWSTHRTLDKLVEMVPVEYELTEASNKE